MAGRVFVELNGQPRVIRAPNRLVKSQTAARLKADPANEGHVGAPMPGVVASVAVTQGARVRPGDLLPTIEAMKMETGLHADREGVVKALHVSAGQGIDAKDLLVEIGCAIAPQPGYARGRSARTPGKSTAARPSRLPRML